MLNQSLHRKKEKIYSLLSEIIEKSVGDKDGRKINRIEAEINRYITLEWNKTATKSIQTSLTAIDTGSARPVTKRESKKILSNLNKAFEGWEKKLKRRLTRDLKDIYQSSRLKFANRFRRQETRKADEEAPTGAGARAGAGAGGLASLTPAVALSFDVIDKSTIDQLVKQHLIAVGDHLTVAHKKALTELIEEAVFERGLPKRKAGKFIEEQFSKRLGGFTKGVPASIRAQGQRAASSYFQGLSATTVTRSRAFGDLLLMQEAGISKFIWTSVVDNRTSQICVDMDGREFSVDLGIQQMDGILEQNSADGMKSNFKWRTDLSGFGLKAGQRLSSAQASAVLAANGVPIVPPAHFRCRSEIHPV